MKTATVRIDTLSGPALTWAFAQAINGEMPNLTRVLNSPDISSGLIMGAMHKYRIDLEWFIGQGKHAGQPVCAYVSQEDDMHQHYWGADIIEAVARCVVAECDWKGRTGRSVANVVIPVELAGG